MIRCLLVSVTRNKRGQPMREERIITGTELKIGRGADCKVHLPDPRVNLQQAVIRNAEDGRLYIETLGSPININGNYEVKSKLRPGTRIGVGPYELTTEPRTGDHDFILTVELLDPLPDDIEELKARANVSLGSTLLSKRWPALFLFFFILAAFLVAPMMSATKPEIRQAAAQKLPVTLDESWNPGPLAHPHQTFGRKCNDCHEMPFVKVRDQACESCHKSIGGHTEVKAMQVAAFGQTRCAECHRDHKGPRGLIRTDTTLCTNCHSNIHASAPQSKMANIADFASDHPPFKLAMLTGKNQVTRVVQDPKTKLVEKSGLKFPHDVHLDKRGIKSPTGGKITLECKNCHTADAAGVRFEPIKMEKHCGDCHRMEFEPAVTKRVVPHGDPKLALTTLREFYSAIAIGETPIDVTTVDGLLRRPLETNSEVARKRAMQWAEDKAQKVAADLIEDRVCGACHTVTKTADAENPWKIEPVFITQHWLAKSRFEHFAHKSAKCEDCHAVAKSKTSEDIAIPDIKNCRGCHSGQLPAKDKVTSTCESCHGFHLGSPKRGATALAPHGDFGQTAMAVDAAHVALKSNDKQRAHP
jgi:predicted CXXCH cytochrome family protein